MKSTGNLTYQSCIYVANFLYTLMILTELKGGGHGHFHNAFFGTNP